MANETPGGQERNEKPTARRLAQARSEGQVARSTELSSAAVVMTGSLLLVTVAGTQMAEFSRRLMTESYSALAFRDMGAGLAAVPAFAAKGFLLAFLPFALGLVVVVTLVNAAQVRGVVSLHPIKPKWEKLSPLKGVKRLFSLDSLFTGGKAVYKLAAIGLVTWWVVARTLPSLTALAGAHTQDVAALLPGFLFRLAFPLCLAYLLLSLVDYLYQSRRMDKNLRMSRQEVLEDHKNTEGNPQVKSRILAMARANARRRMMQDVPKADVVVINPTHIAVALKYDMNVHDAPMVLAMGQRKIAQRIRDIAEKAGVPVLQNKPVARALLATARVGMPIPPALYIAVAEILAYVYRLRHGGAQLPAPRSDGRVGR